MRIMRLVLAGAVLVLTLGVVVQTALGVRSSSKGVSASKEVSAADRVVVDYYESWAIYANSYRPAAVDFRKMTHVNYAFAKIEDGVVVFADPGADPQNFAAFSSLRAKYPHLKVLISIGGWSLSKGFSTAALTQASREKFARSAADFMQRYGLDGIDIDWEYPVCCGDAETPLVTTEYNPAVDKHNFTLLLQELRKQLDIKGANDSKYYLLTAALAASGEQMAKSYEVPEIAKVLDWANLMTYDFHGGWENVSNHNAPLYDNPADPSIAAQWTADATVKRYLAAGLPAEKTVMGIPFYGRAWDNCPATNNGLFQTCSGKSGDGTFVDQDKNAAGVFHNWDLIMRFVNKNGFKRYWDDVAKVPYLYNPGTYTWTKFGGGSASSTGTFISYEDAQSVAIKAQYIKDQGLKGAMAWTVATDKGTGSTPIRSGPLTTTLGDALLPASITQAGAKPKVKLAGTLAGSVGPGSTITLKRSGKVVKTLKAGTYKITVRDRSSIHNFHLFGPGHVNKKTKVGFKGTVVWTVKFKKGSYTYRCDIHFKSGMIRHFKVK